MSSIIPADLIVSVSGIRGIVGRSLTPDVSCRFAMALGSYLNGGRVVVSCDSRPSGRMLRHAVIAGLTAAGCAVADIGIAPTPTAGLAVRHLKASGGIQITASHNPAPWNGLKMFGSDGSVLSAEGGRQVQRLFESGDWKLAEWSGIGEVGAPPDVHEAHIRSACDLVSVHAIHSAGLTVLLDGNGGAGGPIVSHLLRNLGCHVIEHACSPDGVFVHEAEPIPAHLVDVAPVIASSGAAVGFVLDPDADRLALIDEKGNCISEELTLALAVKYRLRCQRGPVVINMSTSRVIEDLARAEASECIRTAVGEANVVAGMRACGAVIGGEGNGGVIDPRVGWVRDPLVGIGLILSLMAEEAKPLSQLIAELPQYSMLKTKYAVPKDRLAEVPTRLKAMDPTARVNEIDGVRLDWADRWVHVRGSNTEPVVRVIAEGPTEAIARELCSSAADCLPK